MFADNSLKRGNLNYAGDCYANNNQELLKKGYSQTYIAKTLHVSRKTIRKIIKSEERGEEKFEKKPHPSVLGQYREFIEIQVSKGLSKQRIYQDLIKEYQFIGSYSTVRNYLS